MAGAVPAARIQWDTNRFVEWYALYAGVNLIDSGGWEFGPAAMLRLGRQDVADEVVKKLPEIDHAFDLGVFGGYSYLNTNGILFRVRVGVIATTTVTGESGDTNITPYLTTWVPLSPSVYVGLGVGTTWASSTYMQRYYGVTPSASASSGLPSYSPGAGIRQVYAWPALIIKLNESWYLGGGAYYQRLTGGASSSPIIEQRGSSNQWTYGLGAAYAWK
jgi:outer membrane protein